MLCDVCGRDNPDRLLYCQDCGKRLKAKAQPSQPAAPAPAAPRREGPAEPGLTSPAQALASPAQALASPAQALASPAQALEAQAPEALALEAPAAGSAGIGGTLPHFDADNPRRSRPEAPNFSFAPPSEDSVAAQDAAPESAPCSVCGASNPTAHRYCAVCGSTLLGAPSLRAPLTSAAAAPPVQQGIPVVPSLNPQREQAESDAPPTDANPASAQPVIGTPVVAIAPPQAPRSTMQTCPRCQGQSDGLARFCKFCGGALAGPPGQDAGHAAARPAAAPPSAPRSKPPSQVPRAPASRPAEAIPAPIQPAPVLPSLKPAAPALHGQQAPSVDTIQTRAPDQLRKAATGPASAAVSELPTPLSVRKPPAKALARLIVVVEDGSDGKVFELPGREAVVGRESGDVVLADDPYVSPKHARLRQEGGKWLIEDLGATNGVYLRTRRRTPLLAGDLILLGSQVLQFHLVSEEERHLGPVAQHGTRVLGSKPVTRVARLDQRTTIGLTGDVYYVYRDETVLGREAGDIVFTSDAFLSRKHAILRRDPQNSGFTIEDLDSSNGTYLAIRGKAGLENGDRLRFGQHLFRFECSPSSTP